MNYGKRPISNADKAKPQMEYRVGDDLRLDRRPAGRVERWIDPQGGVMSIQMYADGDPNAAATYERSKLQRRRDGFVKHSECPLRHGTHLVDGPIARDFRAALGKGPHEPCASDPRTMTKVDGEFHAGTGCPHIETLIEYRVAQEAKAAAKRNEKRAKEEKIEADRRELEAMQLEELKEKRKTRRAGKVDPA